MPTTISFTLSDAQVAVVQDAVAEYNARHNTTLTARQWVQRVVKEGVADILAVKDANATKATKRAQVGSDLAGNW